MVASPRRGLRASAATAREAADDRRWPVGRRADRRDRSGQHRPDAAGRLRPLAPRHRPSHVRVDPGQPVLPVRRTMGRERSAHVLSTIRPDGPPGWNFDLPVGAGTYHALFPFAWYEVDWDELPVRIVQRQFSPVIPHNYRESSYPVAIFETTIENRSAAPVTAGLMFSWQNVLGRGGGLDGLGGQRHEAVRRDGLAGVVHRRAGCCRRFRVRRLVRDPRGGGRRGRAVGGAAVRRQGRRRDLGGLRRRRQVAPGRRTGGDSSGR